MRSWLACAAALCALTACGLNDEGDTPARGSIYFPTALELSAARADGTPKYLFVLNSNFDLRFNAGSVQAFDLDRVDEQIRERCEPGQACLDGCEDTARMCRLQCAEDFPEPSTGNASQDDAGVDDDGARQRCLDTCQDDGDACIEACDYDGDCTIPTTEDVQRNASGGDEPRSGSWPGPLVDEVRVSSFGTTMLRAADGKHLFAATRQDDYVTVIGLNEAAKGSGVLACSDESPTCGTHSSRGDNDGNTRKPPWPGDPMAMLTGTLSGLEGASGSDPYVVVAHRDGSVSLFVERGSGSGHKLELAHTLEDVVPGGQITGLARDPDSGLLYVTYKQFTGTAKFLARVGVAIDDKPKDADPDKPFLYQESFVRLDGVAVQPDTRSIVFLDAPSGLDGSRALVVTQIPQALMWIDPDVSEGEVPVASARRLTEVGAGATHVVTGLVGGRELAFVSCFDSREVFVIDVESGQARSVVRNLSGPFDIALDEGRQRLYVADFRTSVVRVLDLAPVTAQADDGTTTAYVAATLGELRVVQELQ